MKDKNKKIVFIIQLSEGILKIAQCLRQNNSGMKFISLNSQAISSEKELAGILSNLGYQANEIVAALPINQATCRYLKVPSNNPQELEKISALQAGRYLPYPAQDLVTAYQIIQTNEGNYSDIVLTIAHKSSIAGYLSLLDHEPRRVKLSVILSAYGICNLYYHLEPKEAGAIMLVDIDSQQVELVIAEKKKVLFSRSFKMDRNLFAWEDVLSAEIIKTKDVFAKEALGKEIAKIVLIDVKDVIPESRRKIQTKVGITAESLNYADKLSLKIDLSFASLLGLSFGNLDPALNILPSEAKEKNSAVLRGKEYLKAGIFIGVIILVFFLGIIKNANNKERYLNQLKQKLVCLSKEAQGLEKIEKRFRLAKSNALRKDSPLGLLYELHQIMPSRISLLSLSYEEDKLVILRGSSSDLNAIFSLVSTMEKSPVFFKFKIRIKYATRKTTRSGERVDFEIGCAK